MKYTKPALSVEDQIKKLRGYGMCFDDEKRAAHYQDVEIHPTISPTASSPLKN